MDNRTEPLVTVLATGDPFLIAIAKSVLDEADIPYMVKNETLQELMKPGRFGLGFNPIAGPVEILVFERDVEEAQELLEDFEEYPSLKS